MKDDLESLGYLIMKLCFGELSWERLEQRTNSQSYQTELFQQKMHIFENREELGFPDEIVQYLDYVDKLTEDSIPDYSYLTEIFQQGLTNLGGDFQFDWIVMDEVQNDLDGILERLNIE